LGGFTLDDVIEKHWTHRLFVDEAEVYLPFLEVAIDRAGPEASAVAALLRRAGVPDGGRLLDVACGIGRHSVPLAGLGYAVTGIDISPLFVRLAEERAAAAGVSVDHVAGDMQQVGVLFADRPPFDAFINMFTSHGYYGREGDVSLFRQLRRLAAPSAVIVVLTSHRAWFVRNFVAQGLDRAGRFRVIQRRHLEASTLVSDWEFYEVEPDGPSLRLKLPMEHQVYDLDDLKGVLEEAGWLYLDSYGSDRGSDFKLEELTADSKTMWVVARAPEGVHTE
jgi:SAM-dependent methyltransferase